MAPWLAVLLIALGVQQAVSALRLTGEAGRARLLGMREIRAQATYSTYRSGALRAITALNVVNAAVGTVLWWLDGWVPGIALSAAAALALPLAGRYDSPVAGAAALGALLVLLVGALWLAVAQAWRFGDEQAA